MKTQIKNFLFACTFLISFTNQAQEPARVNFTVKNPTLKNKTLDFKSYDSHSKMIAGYGYGLNALGSHATNMPTPTYVYEEKNGKKELLFVVTKEDEGKTFSVNQHYEISREQYLAAANGEMNLKNTAEERNEDPIVHTAVEKGIKLIGVKIKSHSWLPSMAYIRYELPWGNDKQVGFSSSMSRFNAKYAMLPVGTKIYQCSDKYWSKSTKFTEKLILTVDGSRAEVIAVLD